MSKRLACLILCAASFPLVVSSVFAGDLVGTAAPDFALRSTTEKNLRLSELRSDVVLLTFWSDWCGRCRSVMPMLNSLHAEYRDNGLQMLAVDVEGELEHARLFAAENQVAFPVLADANQQVSRAYDLNQMPFSVLLDREGKVRFVHAGFKDDIHAELSAQLEELLAE